MKKISFFVAIAAAASLASCTAQAPKANMKNDVDSLSYMMGITNTQGLDMYMSQQLGVDTTYMADFIRGGKHIIKLFAEHGFEMNKAGNLQIADFFVYRTGSNYGCL